MRYPPDGIRGMVAAMAKQSLNAGALFVAVGVARRCW